MDIESKIAEMGLELPPAPMEKTLIRTRVTLRQNRQGWRSYLRSRQNLVRWIGFRGL